MEKVKVNWRKQYKLDNIFNIVMALLVMIILCLDVNPKLALIPVILSLHINVSALRFFVEKEKYH